MLTQIQKARNAFANLQQGYVPIWSNIKHNLAWNCLKHPLETPCGDDSKGKVMHFVFHLFIVLITAATGVKKTEQCVMEHGNFSLDGDLL